MFEELSELSHDELQYVIDGYFLWAYNTMKQRGINQILESLEESQAQLL